jgi:transcriptional regulator with XRE-family HTH domain
MRLCRLADTSPQSWNNYETADSNIGIEPAIRLCNVTGVTLDWIYRGIKSGLPFAIQEALAAPAPSIKWTREAK